MRHENLMGKRFDPELGLRLESWHCTIVKVLSQGSLMPNMNAINTSDEFVHSTSKQGDNRNYILK